ncbi:MFS transporter [Desulfosarcina sp.]|uniref:MFS transporter n=1 Tax=Desulfosarcina sp. TaxID=2027861 RepID=UPI003970A6FB
MTDQQKSNFFYGYIIVAACFLIQGIGIGSYIAYGVFFPSLLAEFGWSRTTISGASSVAFLLMGFLGILAGNLNDKIGPRIIMTITGIFLGCSYMLLSRIDAAWQLYIFYGLIAGIGLSSIDVIPLTTTARWFLLRRGIMTGLVKVGTGAGQLAMPLLSGLCITHLGWRSAYVVIGTIVLVSIIGSGQFLRRDPGQMGQFSDGRIKPPTGANPGSESGLTFQQALRNRQFWMLCTLSLLAVSSMLTILVHIVAHATDIGIGTIKAAGVLSTIGGVSMLGRLTVGIAIDGIGTRKCLRACLIILILSFLWLQIARGMWMLYFFAAIYGIAHGGFFTVISPIVAELFGIRSHGALFGIVAFSGTVGGAIGPVLAGLVFDVTRSYRLTFMVLVVLAGISFLLSLLLKPADFEPPPVAQ